MPEISMGELIKLAAVDSDLFGRTFFPKAMRQKSPDFDRNLWKAVENPNHRLLNLRVFRGGGKTTKLRIFTAKRIAYNVSKTILYIGASEAHATRSIQWLRAQIEPKIGAGGVLRPSQLAATFGLRPGRKWQENEIEIYHGVDHTPIWVLGCGVTSNIRGINFDDYRPDLIIVDDVVTDENALTQPAAEKIVDLVLNAVANSLASSVEFPNAKLVMLQTPISPYDVSMQAEKSMEWHTESFGCWTPETSGLPVEQQISAWPEMFETNVLRKRKIAAIAERRYSGFAREMECKLIAAESLSFGRWLKFYQEAPKGCAVVIAVDPVPPPSERQIKAGMRNKDYEAIAVIGRKGGNYFLLDYAMHRGHEPDWTEAKVFEFVEQYRPMKIVVEAIAAQRYLKWFLTKAMERRRRYVPIVETPNDQRAKFLRIVTSLSGIASNGLLYCSPGHSEFILQFESYGPGFKGNEDLLEAVSVGCSALVNPYLELNEDEYSAVSDDIPQLKFNPTCP